MTACVARQVQAALLKAWHIACVLLLVAPALARPPELVHTEYLVSGEITFVVVGGEGVKYEAAFELTRPFPVPIYVTVDFENPADPQSPLFQELEVPAGQLVIHVKSPGMMAVRNRKDYLVKVWLYEDPLRKKLLGMHEQIVAMKLPKDFLKLLGVHLL